MPAEALAGTESLAAPGPSLSPAWRGALLRLGLVWAALILVFASDWAAMAGQWLNSSTYNHIVLIPPIIAWLVWLRLPQLVRLEPGAWWPGLIVFGGAMLLWVLGSFSGFNLARELGVVAMLGAVVLTVLGPKIGAGLAFPLGYMLALVPFGDELVPPLQLITARLTIALTQLSQIKATIDGVFIDTPAGLFEVAEACSGVKFLIAMIALGALVANVCFVSNRRRILFLALCVVMPVLANAVRAWGTIYVAQFKGAAYAGGIDHIVYGWIFFAVVIALVLALSWRTFDRAVDDPMIDAAALEASPWLTGLAALRLRPISALAGLALLVGAGNVWTMAVERLSAPVPQQILLPEVPGWTRVNYAPQVWWEPRARGADHRLLGRYRSLDGARVDVFYALYAAQDEGCEAGGFGQGALTPESKWQWDSPGPALTQGHSDRLLALGQVRRLAETYYRTGTLLTGSNLRLKLANMADRLLLRRHTTAMLILSAEEDSTHPAAQTTAQFRRATGPVDRWMDRIAIGG